MSIVNKEMQCNLLKLLPAGRGITCYQIMYSCYLEAFCLKYLIKVKLR